MTRQTKATTRPKSSPSGSSGTETVRCGFCDQTVPTDELVTIHIERTEHTVCEFCAASLFENIGPSQRAEATADHPDSTDGVDASAGGPTAEQTTTAGVDVATQGGGVSWSAPRPRSTTGVVGSFLQLHYLSVSLLWAIHRTHVSLVEQVLEEVDIHQLMMLVVVVTAMIASMSVATA